MASQNKEKYYDLWASLYRTRDFVFALRKEELSKHGISPGQSSVMWAINQLNNKANNKDISRYIFRKRHSTYEMIARMEKQGLVEKVREDTGSKSDRVGLTPKGEEVWKNSRKEGFIPKIFSVLTEKECKQLHHCLAKLQNETIKHLSIEAAPLTRL